MSEPRKDVKVYLDPEIHSALRAICAAKDIGLGEYIERLVAPHVREIAHEAMVLADEFRRLGIARNLKESPGKAGDGAEWSGK